MGGWAPQKRKESQCRPATRRDHSRSLHFYLAGTRFSQPGIGLCAQRPIVGFGRLQSKGRVGHGGACVRGIPTFVTSDLAICWSVANTNLNNIETPEYPDRTQWVHDIGYKMWSTDEIRNGTVLKRFKKKLGLDNA